jgi:glutaredoxin-like protein
MALLQESDRRIVSERLASIEHPVRLLFFTQTIGAPESTLVARQILDEVASLHDKVTVEEVNFVLEKDRAASYGIEDIPAIVLLQNDTDTRMRFLGAPSGYEFMSLIDAVVLAGTTETGLSETTRQSLKSGVTEPLDILVFVTPTCPHCPKAVTLAHRLAVESPLIRATCVEATEFMELSRRYRVNGVPKTVVVNRDVELLGALPEDEVVRGILAGIGVKQSDDGGEPVDR